MKATPEQVERVRERVGRMLERQREIGNLAEIMDNYRTGNIPRHTPEGDIAMRWRWDVYWAAMSRGNDPDDSPGEGEAIQRGLRQSGLRSDHIDTILRRVVPALTPIDTCERCGVELPDDSTYCDDCAAVVILEGLDTNEEAV